MLNQELHGEEVASNFEIPLLPKDMQRFDILLNATAARCQAYQDRHASIHIPGCMACR